MPDKQQNPRPRVQLDGVRAYLNTLEAPKVESRRQSLIIALLVLAVAMLATAIALMVPLQRKVPYFLEVETATGAVSVSGRVAEAFEPTEPAIRYFLRRWVIDTYTIDEAVRLRLGRSLSYLRGNAIQQFERLIMERERPLPLIAENPQHRRSVEIVAQPSFIADNAVITRVALTERGQVIGRRQITLRFAIIPPTNDEEVMRNPIGLWITDIAIVDETL